MAKGQIVLSFIIGFLSILSVVLILSASFQSLGKSIESKNKLILEKNKLENTGRLVELISYDKIIAMKIKGTYILNNGSLKTDFLNKVIESKIIVSDDYYDHQ